MMRIVKAFIAADDELASDRAEFKAMLEGLNQVLARRDIRVEVSDYDQDRHEALLKDSEIALVLYHTRCGDFAAKEVDEAYHRVIQHKNPKRLYIFFKEDNGLPLTPEFKAFRDSFVARFEHFFCRFENVDTLKLNFLLSIENLLSQGGGEPFVKLDGSQVKVDGMVVGSFRNLPMVKNNAGLGELFASMETLQKEFYEQRARVSDNPSSVEAYEKLLNLSTEVNKLQEQIDRELSLAFGLAKRMSGVSIGETNEVLARARSCMEQGKIKEAIDILDSADTSGRRARMLRRKMEEVDEARLELKEFSSYVELEIFRMQALLRYESLALELRTAQVTEIQANVLSELQEYRENSSVQFGFQIDEMISRIKALTEITKGESK
jgi:hypothetical protein